MILKKNIKSLMLFLIIFTNRIYVGENNNLKVETDKNTAEKVVNQLLPEGFKKNSDQYNNVKKIIETMMQKKFYFFQEDELRNLDKILEEIEEYMKKTEPNVIVFVGKNCSSYNLKIKDTINTKEYILDSAKNYHIELSFVEEENKKKKELLIKEENEKKGLLLIEKEKEFLRIRKIFLDTAIGDSSNFSFSLNEKKYNKNNILLFLKKISDNGHNLKQLFQEMKITSAFFFEIIPIKIVPNLDPFYFFEIFKLEKICLDILKKDLNSIDALTPEQIKGANEINKIPIKILEKIYEKKKKDEKKEFKFIDVLIEKRKLEEINKVKDPENLELKKSNNSKSPKKAKKSPSKNLDNLEKPELEIKLEKPGKSEIDTLKMLLLQSEIAKKKAEEELAKKTATITVLEGKLSEAEAKNAALMARNKNLEINNKEENEVFFGKNIVEKICRSIDEAKEEILIAVYDFTNKEIYKKLSSAYHRGVKITIISDLGIYQDINRKEKLILDFLTEEKKTDSKKKIFLWPSPFEEKTWVNGILPKMHNKFSIFDGKFVLLGSANFTQSVKYNKENVICFKKKNIIESYYKEFFNTLKESVRLKKNGGLEKYKEIITSSKSLSPQKKSFMF